jgi:hypothetical protein
MNYELVSIIGGTALLAAGIWRVGTRSQRGRASAIVGVLICACALLLIAAGAIRSGSGWAPRITILGGYSASGAFLGFAITNALAKHHAGAVLASLGTGVSGRVKVIAAICLSIGIISVVAQLLEADGKDSLLRLFGQALFFISLGLHFLVLARYSWRLSERGIIGPDVFVPWSQVLSYDWGESNKLTVTKRAALSGARQFTIPFVPEARERAAEVLSSKVASVFGR